MLKLIANINCKQKKLMWTNQRETAITQKQKKNEVFYSLQLHLPFNNKRQKKCKRTQEMLEKLIFFHWVNPIEERRTKESKEIIDYLQKELKTIKYFIFLLFLCYWSFSLVSSHVELRFQYMALFFSIPQFRLYGI